MADNVLRIGAEFDVSQIVAGSKTAVTAIDSVGTAASRQAEAFKAQGLTAEQTASALGNLGYTQKEIAETVKTATAATVDLRQAQEKATVSVFEARSAIGLLSGESRNATTEVARLAAESQILGVAIKAALPILGAIAFVEIFTRVIERFKEASNAVAGYTEEVKRAEAADARMSTESLSSASTLEQATRKLGDAIRRNGEIAAETFGDKWSKSFETATGSVVTLREALKQEGVLASLRDALIATAKDPFTPFQALIGAMTGLKNAESEAATEAIRLMDVQRALFAARLEAQVDDGREASKLIDLQLAATNASLTGTAGRVQAIRNEIAALKDKQAVEEKTARAEASKKFINQPDQALAAGNQAADRIAEESYLKRIELVGKLSAAEIEAAREQDQIAGRAFDTFQQLRDAKEKNASESRHLIEEENIYFARGQEKDVNAAIAASIKEVEARVKYQEDTAKLAEQTSLARVSAEESAATSIGQLEELRRQGTARTELGRVIIAEQVSAEVIAKERALSDQRLQIEMDYLDRIKAIQLGGQSEQDYVGTASPAQLTKLQQINSQIEAAQSTHVAKMAELDVKQATDSQKTANAIEASYMKIFAPITQAFDGTIQGILQGTQTVSEGFARMAGNIILSTINAIAKIGLEWAEHFIVVEVLEQSSIARRIAIAISGAHAKAAAESTADKFGILNVVASETAKTGATVAGSTARTTAVIAGNAAQAGATVAGQTAQTTAVVAGESTRSAVETTAETASVGRAAATAAAHAFKAVMAALPFPLDVVVAPVAAAGTFAAVLAYQGLAGKAEGGAVVPEDMPIFAHAQEMILPAPISSGLRSVIPAMQQFSQMVGGSNSTTNNPVKVIVQALDVQGVRDFIRRNSKQFAAASRTMARNGVRI